MKRFLTWFLLFAAALLLYAYALPGDREGHAEDRTLSQIGKELGLDVSAGTLVRFEDSHGGFHGDGLTAAVVDLDGAAERLSNTPGWKPLPMSEAELHSRYSWNFTLAVYDSRQEQLFFYQLDK